MTPPENAAIVGTLILVSGIVLQVLLVAGMPFGRVAWGGLYRILPARLRLGSVVAALVLGVAAWTILVRAGLVAPRAESIVVRAASWVFVGVFVLNTIGNLASSNRTERYVMTPMTVLLVTCFLVVALSGSQR